MRKGVIALKSTNSVYDAARLMSDSEVGSVIVIKDNKAVGIVTERDLVRKVIAKKKNPIKTKLNKIMSHPLRVIKIDAPIRDAAIAMRKYNIKKLPVMVKKKIIGMITETDVLRAYPSLVDLLIEEEIIKRYNPNLADLSQYNAEIKK